MIELPVLMGIHLQQISIITNFIVVEALSTYNVILEMPTLNQAKAVDSTYSLFIKFLTPQGTKIIKENQAITRSCYVTSLRKDTVSETLAVEDLREKKDRMSPVKELIQIIPDPEHPDRVVNINSLLEPELRGKLIQFLQKS